MPYAQVRKATVDPSGQQLKIQGLPLRPGRVDVVVIPHEEPPSGAKRYPLHGVPIRYEAPFEPATSPDDWEANA
jgi:hypothetical protein